MKLRELFKSDVTRDIPPVVYFHEQSPEKLEREVAEYIITGGFPTDHPQHKRVPDGIHEQYVRLLSAVANELDKPGGTDLPASWISGFFGSGKSSFAKLLGLAFDGVALPDGRSLAEAWLARDASPRASELRDAWKRLRQKVDPLAVVFDIGSRSRSGEHVHSAIVRHVQERLGYCKDPYVAEAELKLERDGHWKAFEAKAQETLKRPWSEALRDAMADELFSYVMNKLYPERCVEPMSWIAARAGSFTHSLSADEATRAIADVLERRAPGKTLFVVVDEVSQYVHQDTERMLKLQSFVSELGKRLKGKAWVLMTGQQQLEEAGDLVLGNMKDRFPERLRVHLATSNIRDVVHKRLLQKKQEHVQVLRDLFKKHRQDLQLFAYGCEDVSESDFIDIYPLLPGHIELISNITTEMRTRSQRSQGDDQAIRGLLQLLGELFRTQRLADAELGALVTLDQVYEVQHTGLDADVQTSMARVLNHCANHKLDLAARAAKAVALLQLIQEDVATDAKLVARCLYDRLDRGSREDEVRDALEELRRHNLLSYSEKQGYKLQSSSGEEWARDRDIRVGNERISELISDVLTHLIADPEKPKLQGRPFSWVALFSDGGANKDSTLVGARDPSSLKVSFQFLPRADRDAARWINLSAESTMTDRLIWVVGDPDELTSVARELARSKDMIRRYAPKRESLSQPKRDLLRSEEARAEDLDDVLRSAASAAWLEGQMYFQGKPYRARDFGSSFGQALSAVSEERVLRALYPHFVATRISPAEVLQLIEPQLNAPSPKFLDDLGVLSLEAGKYEPTCHGVVPDRIKKHVESEHAVSGALLIAYFGGPPYGYAPEVVRACVAGLLRAHQVRIEPEAGQQISAVRDAGVREVFETDRGFKRATIIPAGEDSIPKKDLSRICKLFEVHFTEQGKPVSPNREPGAVADAVATHFPRQMQRLRGVLDHLRKLPDYGRVPYVFSDLEDALEACVGKARYTEPAVREVRKRLDTLNDGLPRLGAYAAELADDAVQAVRAAHDVLSFQLAQLEALGPLESALVPAAARIKTQLADECSWRNIAAIADDLDAVRTAYRAQRRELLSQQEWAAEAARNAIKGCDGFSTLTADQSHQVLRPITDALPSTGEDAIAPPLVQLRDGYLEALRAAEEDARERLDALRSRIETTPVHKVAINLKNREVRDAEELERALSELRTRVLEQLKAGGRVRLV
jgi:hypothetical protein